MQKSKTTGNEFTLKQLEVIDLLSLGDLNQTEIQEKVGISHDTMWRWKQNPQFMEEVIRTARLKLRNELPDIYNSLTKMAKKGDWHHIKILLEHLSKLEEFKSNTLASNITFTWGIDREEVTEEDLAQSNEQSSLVAPLSPEIDPSGC